MVKNKKKKNPPTSARDARQAGSTHSLEDPLYKEMTPTPVFLPGKFHGQRSLTGHSPWGRKELDMTERLYFPFQIHIYRIMSKGFGPFPTYILIHPPCLPEVYFQRTLWCKHLHASWSLKMEAPSPTDRWSERKSFGECLWPHGSSQVAQW